MAIFHFTDKGHELFFQWSLGNATPATNFYIALLNDTVVGTDDWADVSANEITSGNDPGYAQQTINCDLTAAGWPTVALDSAEMMATGVQVTFTPTGNGATNITAIALVANMATDRLIGYANISATAWTLGDPLKITPKLKLTKS